MTQPLTDDQLAAIQARFERTTHPDWRAETDTGRLLAEVHRLRAELAAAQGQLAGVWPCTCGHLPRQHDHDAVLGRDFCRGCPGDTDLHDYTPEPAKES